MRRKRCRRVLHKEVATMADQLSLFPSDDLPTEEREEKSVSPADISALDEMFTASPKYHSWGSYRQMLTFISRFP